MLGSACPGSMQSVALRKESVDRNKVTEAEFFCIGVALRKESVDRNLGSIVPVKNQSRRSPQGERG